jgi:cyclic pyranopterin phosphate synthase
LTADKEERQSKGQSDITHLDEKGRARMVDVSAKDVTERTAKAQACVVMKKETLDLVLKAGIKKGDVLAVAQVAGIMAAKNTSELIPMCHPISIAAVNMDFEIDEEDATITAVVTTKTRDRTGIEMEALTGAAVAALTIYDMCKGVDRSITITDIQLLEKTGGRSGTYTRDEDEG